jgi:hypothetical protein
MHPTIPGWSHNFYSKKSAHPEAEIWLSQVGISHWACEPLLGHFLLKKAVLLLRGREVHGRAGMDNMLMVNPGMELQRRGILDEMDG